MTLKYAFLFTDSDLTLWKWKKVFENGNNIKVMDIFYFMSCVGDFKVYKIAKHFYGKDTMLDKSAEAAGQGITVQN